MAIDFPSNPTNGQTITVGDITYAYDSTKGVWTDNPQGLTQALDALTDVDTSTVAPTNGQVLVYDSASSKFKPGDMSAGVTVYATINDLPLSGVDEGEMALVDSTDRLYIFSDAGWYNIALVNTSPSISNVATAYTLSTSGSATVITIDAEDPEGIPLTFSLVSDTSGNTATVVQGTGANTNIFTVTPSTNEGDGGTFSLTFRASDGVNIASKVSSFTLQFSIPNSNYTAALITSVGTNNQVNNTFIDSSTNSHTITAGGNATQTTFSPYRHGGYSTYFDGTGDYLSIADDATLRFGTGEFTVECWIYMNSLSRTVFIDKYDGTSAGWQLQYRDYNNVNHIAFSTNAGHYATTPSDEIETNTWYHVAVVRDSSNNIKIYIDGVEKGSSASYTQDLNGTSALNIGVQTYNIAAGYMNGYISDARIVKGTAVYTSAFTPPTKHLTAITNTSLLTCHLPYFADGSTNGHTITINGNTKTEPFSPYDYETYSATNNGGSMYFDGSGDRLTFSHASDFSFGTGDFTIEFWIKAPTNAITGGYARTICEIGQLEIYLRITQYHGGTDGALLISDGSTGVDIGGTVSLSDDRWHHVAIVRESGTAKCWVDGTYMSGVSHTTSLTETGTNAIGARADGNGSLQGTVADLRVVKGTAVYTGTSNFTPPTTPLTAITNTSLLLSGTNAGIIDKSQTAKTLTLNGDVKSSTTQTKYLSSSMAFDGTGDYINVNANGIANFGTNDFTIELWAYANSFPSYSYLIEARNSGSQLNAWTLSFNYMGNYNNNILQFASYNGSVANLFLSSNTAFSTGQWIHIAVTRSGTTMKMFLDGTEVASNNSAGFDFALDQNPIHIGSRFSIEQYFNGYMSDIRITKGLARYTSNFTPPSVALDG